MHPANEDRYDTRVLVCHGCAAIERRKELLADGSERGVRIAVIKS